MPEHSVWHTWKVLEWQEGVGVKASAHHNPIKDIGFLLPCGLDDDVPLARAREVGALPHTAHLRLGMRQTWTCDLSSRLPPVPELWASLSHIGYNYSPLGFPERSLKLPRLSFLSRDGGQCVPGRDPKCSWWWVNTRCVVSRFNQSVRLSPGGSEDGRSCWLLWSRRPKLPDWSGVPYCPSLWSGSWLSPETPCPTYQKPDVL